MAQLLRIAPQVPQIDARVPRQGPNALQYVGQGLAELGQTFEKIQFAADDAESRMLGATAKERLSSVVKSAELEFADPDEFSTNATSRLNETFQSVIDSASNSRVRRTLEMGLADEVLKHNNLIQYGSHAKRIKGAKANSEVFLEDAERRLMGAADPVERTKVEQEIADHLQLMRTTGALDPVDAVKRIQKIKENDAYNRAFFTIRGSSDPLGDLDKFQRENPNLDPNRVRILVERADAEQARVTKQLEKDAKEIKEESVLNAVIEATNQRMTLPQLDILARDQRFTPTEYNQVKTAMESAGVTDPAVYNALEMEIREGRILNYRSIMSNDKLDRQAKSQLMGLITARKDHLISEERSQRAEGRAVASERRLQHFSNQPAYQEAVKEYRAAISAKGPMESFSDKENRQYLWGLRQLWDRAGKGEDPMTVSREISERARQMKTDGLFADDPIAVPRFQTPQELAEKLRRGEIDRRQFDEEALLFEQIEKQKKANERRQLERKEGTQPRGRR